MKFSTLIVTLISVSTTNNNYYYATADNKLYQRGLARGNKAGKKHQKKLHQCEMDLDDMSRQLDDVKKENERLRAMVVDDNNEDETTGGDSPGNLFNLGNGLSGANTCRYLDENGKECISKEECVAAYGTYYRCLNGKCCYDFVLV